MKKIKELLCLVVAVVLSMSCSDNAKMKNLLENIPDNADVVYVGNVKTVLESAGGKIENSQIVLPEYITNEMASGDTKEYDEMNDFLKDSGIDLEACALMYSFKKNVPVMLFALEDNDKFVKAIKDKEFEKDTEENDVTIYVNPEKGYGDPKYIAINGSCAYMLQADKDVDAVRYLQRIIEDADENNYAGTPYGDYILDANGGGLAFKLPAEVKAELRNKGTLTPETEVILNAVYCMRGELTSNKGTLECKVFPKDGEEFDVDKLAKMVDLSSTVSDKALKFLGNQENMVLAMSLKNANWDELSNLIATTSRLSRAEKAQMNAVFSYLEKIDGTVAYGFGMTQGIESYINIDKGQEVLKQFSTTIVVETKEGKAKQLIEDMKGFMEQMRVPFKEDATGFSIDLTDQGMGGKVYVKNVDNFIVLANHEIKESNDNPLVKSADFDGCVAALYVGMNSGDKLSKDLDVKDNMLLGICCKPKDGTAYVTLEVDGNSDSGVIEKFAKIIINSKNKLQAKAEEAYAEPEPDSDVEFADTDE